MKWISARDLASTRSTQPLNRATPYLLLRAYSSTPRQSSIMFWDPLFAHVASLLGSTPSEIKASPTNA